MQRDDVGFREQLVERVDVRRERCGFVVAPHVVGEDPAAEPAQVAHHGGADLARADHADGLVAQLEPDEPAEREVVLTNPVVGTVHTSPQRQDERQRELRHRVR